MASTDDVTSVGTNSQFQTSAPPEPKQQQPRQKKDSSKEPRTLSPAARPQERTTSDAPLAPVTTQKRRRFPVSCYECRQRKLKCDREHPCQRCRHSGKECIYANQGPPVKAARTREKSVHGVNRAPKSTPAAAAALENTEQRTGGLLPDLYHPPTSLGSREQFTPIGAPFGPINSILKATPSCHLPAPYVNQNVAPGFPPRTIPHMNPADPNQVPISRLLSASGHLSPPVTVTSVSEHDTPSREKEHCGEDKCPKEEDHPCKGKIFVRGKNGKTRYYGKSHLSSLITQFDGLRTFLRQLTSLHPALPRCCTQSRDWKEKLTATEENEEKTCFPNLVDNLPDSAAQCDDLVRIYMAVFESTHRVLHIPSFWRAYGELWRDKRKASEEFVAQLLLVLACAILFRQDPGVQDSGAPNTTSRRQQAVSWVYAVELWLCRKQRPELEHIRVGCLLVMAKQVNGIDEHNTWPYVGSLVRSAMAMGLHRDPEHLMKKVSIFYAEMRRRLWATILELDLQSAMEIGMPVTIRPGDYDTKPPLNINDWDVLESTEVLPETEVSGVSETSFQCVLLESLPVRSKIAELVNRTPFDIPYEQVLELDKEITQRLRNIPHNLRIRWQMTSEVHKESGISFPVQALEIYLRRYILALHIPFAIQAIQGGDLRYNYSRYACRSNASVMLSHCEKFPDSAIMRALRFGDEHSQAAIALCFDLFGDAEDSDFISGSREKALELAESVLRLMEKNIELRGRGMKRLLFLSVIIARVRSKDNPQHSEEIMRAAAHRCARAIDMLPKPNIFTMDTPAAVDNAPEIPVTGNDFAPRIPFQSLNHNPLLIDDIDLGLMDFWEGDLLAGWS